MKEDKIIYVGIVLIALVMGYGIYSSETTYETILTESVNIYSLSLNSGVDSNFVLGTGSSRTTLNYYFFKDWEEGKRLDCADASVTKIIETDEEIPTLKRYEIHATKTFYFFTASNYYPSHYIELFVPVNTTQTSFSAEV